VSSVPWTADPQVVASGLVGEVEQPGLGSVRLLAPFIRVGGETVAATAAPELGADTESVLEDLA
jgi:crotonobetainyl-CoA:carnitine CoA-transferase CaiB-like acyl-CoA transferase